MGPWSIRRIHAYNLSTLRRSPLAEISGSLGDLGTLLPILIALTRQDAISLPSTLVFSGLANILTGVFFGIPLPVQPMKAIAAVAISRSLTRAETTSAGLFVAVAVLLFSVTGLLRWFTRVIPVPVVKGIQVGAGLSLVLSAGSSLLQPLGWVTPSWADNLLWALFALLLLLAVTHVARFPYALFLFLLGLFFSMLQLLSSKDSQKPRPWLWHPSVVLPSWHDFRIGAIDAGVGQLPLTTLNSIIAVAHLSADLLPTVPPPSTTELGLSVAAMNLVGCWFGAMPVCHGSGGLAAQYRFGARSGASIMILGSLKLILGLFVGESLVEVLQRFPKALLGVMVIAAGLELAKVGESLNLDARDLGKVGDGNLQDSEDDDGGVGAAVSKEFRELDAEERQRRWTIMFMTVGGLLAFRNDAVGFAAGMLCHWTYEAPEQFRRFRRLEQEIERESLLGER